MLPFVCKHLPITAGWPLYILILLILWRFTTTLWVGGGLYIIRLDSMLALRWDETHDHPQVAGRPPGYYRGL